MVPFQMVKWYNKRPGQEPGLLLLAYIKDYIAPHSFKESLFILT